MMFCQAPARLGDIVRLMRVRGGDRRAYSNRIAVVVHVETDPAKHEGMPATMRLMDEPGGADVKAIEFTRIGNVVEVVTLLEGLVELKKLK